MELFRKLFKRDGFYSWGTIKYLLYVYDISKTQTLSEQRLDPTDYFKQDPKDSYSIEHIYPQKAVDEYWVKRFNMYSEKERKALSSSLGNMLPLSKRINSKLQNYSFDTKKERYINGSRSEQLVADKNEWTPETILERGLEILAFVENEWNIKFPNLEDKKRILGLDFMIKENDINTDVNTPFYNEQIKEVRESKYDEDQFQKLISNTKPELIDIYKVLDEYVMSLNPSIRKNTTSVYLAYTTTENFIELWFQTNSLKFVIMTGEYDDPNGEVSKLADSYNWKNMRCIVANVDSDLDYVKNILKQSYEMTLK